jgi:uncharacterized protein (TIGR01777 family)
VSQPREAPPGGRSRRVAVTGSHGLIGSALVEALEARGDAVVRLVRDRGGPRTARWDPVAGTVDSGALEGLDAVVHLAGAGIADRRLTAARKTVVHDSRVVGTRVLASALAGLDQPPAVLVSASAVGYYGDRGDEVLDEGSAPGTGFLPELCQAWEAATEPARTAGIRVVVLRSGVVLARHGGALRAQLPLFRLGIGGRLGSGRQWTSYVSLADEVAVILRAIDDRGLEGPVVAATPNPVTNASYTATLASLLHRPARLAVPRLALVAVFGATLADEMLLASQRARPSKLLEAGFRFAHPDLTTALRAALAGRGGAAGAGVDRPGDPTGEAGQRAGESRGKEGAPEP